MSIISPKLDTDIPGVYLKAVRTPPQVYGHCQKPPGSIGMVLGEGHGYENLSADIYGYWRRCIRTIGTSFTDDKDASRTIRMGFKDTFSVSHNTREVTK